MATGARGAAIFDVDGTLIGCSSERTFFLRLARDGVLGPRHVARWMARAAGDLGQGVDAAIRGNRAYLAGMPADQIALLAARHADELLRDCIPDAARAAVQERRDAGDVVILLSGSLDILVAPLAEMVGADAYRASALEAIDGRLTGRLSGAHPVGPAKVEVAQALARSYAFSLDRSTAYGDRRSDAELMSRVATAVAVNPKRALARRARRHGWDIVRWHA